MPAIACFYGICIRMYFLQTEHNPPHVHAIYGEHAAAIDIATGQVLDGWLPPRALGLTADWVAANQKQLLTMRRTQKFKPLPPLD